MRFYHLIIGLFIATSIMKPINGARTLFDFTTSSNVNDWTEMSDTVREVGMSKAVISLQKTQIFQRAIFFTLLNPQPNGAGFAGMRVPIKLDLRQFDKMRIRCRGRGSNSHYKVVLRHKNQSSNEDVVYEQFFDAPMSDDTFDNIALSLANFKPYYRGREKTDSEPLDLEHITMFGLQVYGGVYLQYKQSGVSALEIETIEAYKDGE